MNRLTAASLALLSTVVLAACHTAWGPHPNGTFTFPDGVQRPFSSYDVQGPNVPSPFNQRLDGSNGPIVDRSITTNEKTALLAGRHTQTDGDAEAGLTNPAQKRNTGDVYHPVVFGDPEDAVPDEASNPPTDGPWEICGGRSTYCSGGTPSTVDQATTVCRNMRAGIDGDVVYAPKDLQEAAGSDHHIAIFTNQATDAHPLPGTSAALPENTLYDLKLHDTIPSVPPYWNGTSWTKGKLYIGAGRKEGGIGCPGYAVASTGGRLSVAMGLLRAEELDSNSGNPQGYGAIAHPLAWRVSNFYGGCDDFGGSPCPTPVSCLDYYHNQTDPSSCTDKAVFPACKSDGASATTGLPYGLRLRLDPSWATEQKFTDLGFSNWEKIYARALRDFGAFLMDQTSGFRPILPLGSSSYTAFGKRDGLVDYAYGATSGGTTSVDGLNYQTKGTSTRDDDTAKFYLPSELFNHLRVVDPASNAGYTTTPCATVG